MKEKKYIDRLYQEKFRDFEAAPRPAVWNAIAERLKEEEKKPVIAPLWSRLAGVAAVLAFLLLVGDWFLPAPTGSAVATEDAEDITPLEQDRISTKTDIIPSLPEPAVAFQRQPAEPSTAGAPEKRERTENVVSSEANNKLDVIPGSSPLALSGMMAKVERTSKPQDKPDLIEEILKEQQNDVALLKPQKNFEISTHAAPIYYGNMGKGNFLDPRLNNNSSEGEVTYSYGINIAYNLNDKLKIRSGISKVNMSYNTIGVTYQAIAGSSPIKSVSLESGATMKNPSGVTSGRTPTAGTPRNPAGFLKPGNLNQKMGFLEIPIELEYNLFASKFELNLIGGASTLFLEQNEVSLNSETISAEGRANNLNNISFSTNIGIGLDYNLSDKFKLNLEPMLKYQLNTFESPSADTRPYYFGIYSGFSFKF